MAAFSIVRFIIRFHVSTSLSGILQGLAVPAGNALINSLIHGGKKENVKYYYNDKLQHLFPGTLRGVKAQ